MMIKLKNFGSREEAEVVKSMLESEGIVVLLKADDQGGMRPNFNLLGGVDLLVDSSDLEKAKQLLES